MQIYNAICVLLMVLKAGQFNTPLKFESTHNSYRSEIHNFLRPEVVYHGKKLLVVVTIIGSIVLLSVHGITYLLLNNIVATAHLMQY